MEADWEFEVGGDAPIIEAHWPGFVDLRADPTRVVEVTEAQQFSGLADALVRLNAVNSPVWTSKCDVFDPGPVDAVEFDATDEEAQHRTACYIDLLMRSDEDWRSPGMAEQSCRGICARLREVPLRCCRIDLVIRRAHIHADRDELGVTAYFAACGRTASDASVRLGECLAAFGAVIMKATE
jgi:hypothetical protein